MKKLIALTLIFIMSISSIALAAVPEEIKNDLTEYGIITDYEIPGINRAEAAKIVLSMMCIRDCEPMETSFSDVPMEYWASGYIAMAQNSGIINGMGDGTFAPEEPLTNEQMIKILVCAVGYEPFVRVPYPTGYFMVAEERGILEGLDLKGADIAKREDVAIMVHNAFDTPILAQTGFGTVQEYVIMDGVTGGTELRTLRTDYDKIMGKTDKKDNPFDFDSPEYNKIVLKIKDLVNTDEQISFKNALDPDDKTTYIAGNEEGDIIFELKDKGDISIEKIENGLYAEGWYKGDLKDTVYLVKLKLTKAMPETAK